MGYYQSRSGVGLLVGGAMIKPKVNPFAPPAAPVRSTKVYALPALAVKPTPEGSSKSSSSDPGPTSSSDPGPTQDLFFEQRDGVWYVTDAVRSALYPAMLNMTWFSTVPGPGMVSEGYAASDAQAPTRDALDVLQKTISSNVCLALVKRPGGGATLPIFFPSDVTAAWPMIYGPGAAYAVLDGHGAAMSGLATAAKLASQRGGVPVGVPCPAGQVLVEGVCVAVEKPSICPAPPGGVACPSPQMWNPTTCQCVLPQDKGGDKPAVPATEGLPKWVVPVAIGGGVILLGVIVMAATKR